MSVPKSLRNAAPVKGHGYADTYAEWVDFAADRPPSVKYRRAGRRVARRSALYMQRWCADCRANNLYRARLARMHSAYRRRNR